MERIAERTFVIIKPDSVARGLIGKIISRFEAKGLKIVGMKMLKIKNKQLEELYAHLKGRPFVPEYFKFMKRTPIICLIIEGMGVVDIVRKMCGVTNCREADTSSIRGRYGMSGRMNIIHTSDSQETAEKEIAIIFKPKEILQYKVPLTQIIYSSEELEELGVQKPVSGTPRKIPGKENE